MNAFEKRLEDVKAGLSAELDKLGLVPALFTDEYGCTRIVFQCLDGVSIFPVKVNLGSAVATEADLPWDGLYCETDEYLILDVGHNGWLACGIDGYEEGGELSANPKKALRQIAATLRKNSPVPDPAKNETVIADLDMGYLWDSLRATFEFEGIMDVAFDGSHGVESFGCKLDNGAEFQLAFEDERAVIYIDGREVNACAGYKVDDIKMMVSYEFDRPVFMI